MSGQINVWSVVLAFFSIWITTWIAIALPLVQKFQWRPFQKTVPQQKLILLLPLYLMAPPIIWGANQFLNQSWQRLGISLNPNFGRSLLIGFGIAIAGLLLFTFFKCSLGLIAFEEKSKSENTSTAFLSQTVMPILGLLCLALWIGGIEELVFRGWLQTQLAIAYSPWLVAIWSSAIFAAVHLVWDNREGIWQQPGLFLLGGVLAIARWVDGGSLALAWGLHTGWVWGLACLEAFWPSSPVADKPTWLTGRPAQPLTDVWDLALMAITAGLIWQLRSFLG